MSLPSFSTVNLFEVELDDQMKLIKLKVNNQATRDGWGELVRDGDSRCDVFIFSFTIGDDSKSHVSVVPVYTEHAKFCPHCPQTKYAVQLAFVEGYVPMYTCLCNRLDGKCRDFDTIRYVDIFDNQLVSLLPLRRLKNESQIRHETSMDC